MFVRAATLNSQSIDRQMEPTRTPTPPSQSNVEPGISIIGRDLRITGQDIQIFSAGKIQVDGIVEGIVRGSEVSIGKQASVTGTIAGNQVMVAGNFSGTIFAKTITLNSACSVQGDVHSQNLLVEEGAAFEGHSRRLSGDFSFELVEAQRAVGLK
jgi:cytoskeletal protein CcmA (bactofilin family)